MKIYRIIFYCSLFCSCNNTKSIGKGSIGYDRMLKVADVAFFGAFSYTAAGSGNATACFFYRNDSLKYILFGSGHNVKKHALFTVDSFTDTLKILSSNYYAKYATADTLLMSENECILKKSYYDIVDAGSNSPQKVEFRRYIFKPKELMTVTESFYPGSGIKNAESIKGYWHRTKGNADAVGAGSKSTETPYENMELAKKDFFKLYLIIR